MRAYYHDGNNEVDFTADHDSGIEVTLADLDKVGVLYYHLETEEEVNTVAKQREYRNRDVITLKESTFPGGVELYREKLNVFYQEHLHEDEEIRYILDGEGFFDVRDSEDRWIRTKLSKGDLLILPLGIYHRFTLTDQNYVQLLRLFKDEPKWTALNRPVDQNLFREQYLQSIGAK